PGEVYYLAQEVGSDFYPRFVKPEFIAAVRTVVSNYPITQVPEKVGEIGNKVQAIVENKLKGRHLDVAFVFPWPISSSQGSYSKPLQDLQAKGQ
ncbi:MAG: hypothetical protein HY038_14025, partial [Nitrospirae bacterium]|nr:hypothetical protein [Nitrospirota bacterium]